MTDSFQNDDRENLVSIIIPNFNYAQFLPATIQCVLDQTYKNYELLVVDDGSTDNSKVIISNFVKSDSRVKLVQKPNGGLSSARNEGINASSGSFIAFLDADDLWEPKKLANQLRLFADEKVGAVYSDYAFLIDNKPVMHNPNLTRTELKLQDFISENPVLGSASSIVIRREYVIKTGYFDTALRSLEDLDYWFRLKLVGCEFKFCDSVDVYLRQHSVSMLKNHIKMFFYHQLVLEKQVEQLQLNQISINSINFKNSFYTRAIRMRWYAKDAKRKDLIFFTYLISLKYLGVWSFIKQDFASLTKEFFVKR